jgi:hypothetical protein
MGNARNLGSFLGNNTSLSTINNAYAAGTLVPSSTNPSLIINGAMRIDQRNSGLLTNPNGHFPVDRFAVGNYIPSTTSEQSTTAPSGYSNSLKVTNGTATVPSNQGFTYQVYQFIEGFNTTHLVFGSSSAKTVTLSFWVRSSITGTFAVTLQNSARDRSYISTYTINQADTFEKKTITVNGDVAGTWVGATNGIGLRLIFDIGSGTTRETTAGAWQSGNYTRTSGSARINTTTGATFYVTGVKLEEGSEATDFQRVPYPEELTKCKRYYQVYGGSGNYHAFAAVGTYNTSSGVGYLDLEVTMRAQPTGSTVGTFQASNGVVSTCGVNLSSFAEPDGGCKLIQVHAHSASGFINGYFMRVRANNDATTRLKFDAEI